MSVAITKKERRALVALMVLKGYNIDEIAKEFKISTSVIRRDLGIINYKLIIPCNVGSKKVPYYENEDDYCKTRIYDFNSLSIVEKNVLKDETKDN